MVYDDIISQMVEYYIPRGFRYDTMSPIDMELTTIHHLYDGRMTIKFCSDDSNIIFIVQMDDININEEDINMGRIPDQRRFYLHLQSLPFLKNFSAVKMIEDEINDYGTKDMVSHYKGMIRNCKLIEIGI